MLYLFCGDDAKSKLVNYEKFIKSIPKGTETFFINRNNFDQNQIENLYSGSALFFTKCIVVFSDIFEREEHKDFVLKKLELMAQSENSFVFVEGKLNKPILDIFEKHKATINQFLLAKEKKEKFNNFLLANAFGDRNKLNLWINFRLAVDKGVGLEELTGVLFWKIKDMLLKKNFGKFKESELQNSASKLSYLLPEARKEGQDAEIALEQFLLEAF